MAHVLPNETPDESKYADSAYAPRNAKTRQRKFDFLPKPDPDINDNSPGQPFPQNELEQKPASSDHSKKTPLWLETLRLGIMPTVLGVISIYVTSAINNQQIKNANDIAEQQLASSKQIATAELETQHLSHMVKIFSNIIDHKIAHTDTLHDNDALIQRIQSLQIYGNEALPFLVQLRAHYKSEGEYASGILDTTNKVIGEILKESQLDFHNTPFIGQTDVQLNLRKKSFENYNLTDSYFENVNLYKANFGDATLKNASFTRVDLQETSFKGANLDSAVFNDANLRKTDFTHAYLYGASFGKNCRHIEDALFTLELLLYLGDHPEKPNPIKSIPNDKYTLLLMKHEKELTTRHEQQPASLKDAYSKLEIKGSERQKFRHLLNLFDQLRETIADFNDQNRTYAFL